MKTGKAAVEKCVKKWKSDRDFRAFAGASFSCAATAFFALYNGYLGLTRASVRLARRKRAAGRLTALLRTIGFIDALVSLLTLQNTLIMVQTGGGDPGMLPFTAVSSFAVFLAVLLVSVSAVHREFRREP